MDVKKESVLPVLQDSECEIIEVVDLMKQAKRDVSQTLAEMQAHVTPVTEEIDKQVQDAANVWYQESLLPEEETRRTIAFKGKCNGSI